MIGQYEKALTAYFALFISASNGQLSLKLARDKSIKEGFKSAPDYERLEMMFNLHFPKLKEDFELFKAVIQDVPKKCDACEKVLEKGQLPTKTQRQEFAVAWLRIESSAKILKEKIAKSISAP